MGEYSRLVEAHIRSPAFEPGHNPLIRALSETTANMPDETLMACERYFELAGKRAGDLSTRVATDSDTVIGLVIRVYSRATGEEMKNRCLDLIDRAKFAWRIWGGEHRKPLLTAREMGSTARGVTNTLQTRVASKEYILSTVWTSKVEVNSPLERHR